MGNLYVTIRGVEGIGLIVVDEYIDPEGKSPFGLWFDKLDAMAAAKVTSALTRIGNGNVSGVKSVGKGVVERTLDFGPGYRVYFGRDGDKLVILLAGGTKKRQDEDIKAAQARWEEYKQRKRREGKK